MTEIRSRVAASDLRQFQVKLECFVTLILLIPETLIEDATPISTRPYPPDTPAPSFVLMTFLSENTFLFPPAMPRCLISG